MMRRAQAFRKQGVHRPTQSQRSFSGQARTVTHPNSNWLSTGIYVRAGWVEPSETHRPRTLALMGIASLYPSCETIQKF